MKSMIYRRSGFYWSCIVLCCFFLWIGLGFQVVRAAPSKTFTVNTTTDTADAVAGNGLCADAAGKCSLRAAVQEANAWAGADIISVPVGTYDLATTLNVTQDLTVNGAGRTVTILDGAGAGGGYAFSVSSDYDLNLNDLTIRDFTKALYITGTEANSGQVSLANCTLRDNHSLAEGASGGAIANYCEGCAINLTSTWIYDNSARSCGAISSYGELNILQDSRIHDNTATVGVGGAICNYSGSVSILQSSIYNNVSDGDSNNFGGAIYQAHGGLGILLSQVYNNSASDMGGAIYISDGSFSIQNSAVTGNASVSGGGLYLFTSTPAKIDTVIIDGNQATHGGGIYAWNEVTIENSAIISNTATIDGGGLQVQGGLTQLINSTVSGNLAYHNGAGLITFNNASLNLANVTVSNNTADADNNGEGMGGGVYRSGGTITFKNSLIAGNKDLTVTMFEPFAPDCYGGLVSAGYNLIGRTNILCELSGDLTGVSSGFLSSIDANLLPLTQGVYTTYHHPLKLGPAVDRGNPNGCKDFAGEQLDFDQLGEWRIFGVSQTGYTPRCDLGAVEAQFSRFDLYLPTVIK